MGVYGESAVRAVELIRTGECPDPPAAWERAAGEICCSPITAAKNCPRCAFLGLCEEGLVEGVPAGNYTTSILNKQYALDAVTFLRQVQESGTGEPVPSPADLWREVGPDIAHSGQMDVVVALWKEGYIK